MQSEALWREKGKATRDLCRARNLPVLAFAFSNCLLECWRCRKRQRGDSGLCAAAMLRSGNSRRKRGGRKGNGLEAPSSKTRISDACKKIPLLLCSRGQNLGKRRKSLAQTCDFGRISPSAPRQKPSRLSASSRFRAVPAFFAHTFTSREVRRKKVSEAGRAQRRERHREIAA